MQTGLPQLIVAMITSNRARAKHPSRVPIRIDAFFTVITLDLRGHGQSDQPITAEAYYLDRFRDDILTVPEGFAKTYPAATPGLDQIYRNFAQWAEPMILQTAVDPAGTDSC